MRPNYISAPFLAIALSIFGVPLAVGASSVDEWESVWKEDGNANLYTLLNDEFHVIAITALDVNGTTYGEATFLQKGKIMYKCLEGNTHSCYVLFSPKRNSRSQ